MRLRPGVIQEVLHKNNSSRHLTANLGVKAPYSAVVLYGAQGAYLMIAGLEGACGRGILSGTDRRQSVNCSYVSVRSRVSMVVEIGYSERR